MRVSHHLGTLGSAPRQRISRSVKTSRSYGWFDRASTHPILRIEARYRPEIPGGSFCGKLGQFKSSAHSVAADGRLYRQRPISANLCPCQRSQHRIHDAVPRRRFTTQSARRGPLPPPKIPSRALPSRPAPVIGSRPTRAHGPLTPADDADDELLAVSSEAIREEVAAKIIQQKHQEHLVKLVVQQKELARQELLRQKQARAADRSRRIEDLKRELREQDARIEGHKRELREREARIAAEKVRRWEQYLHEVWTIHYRDHFLPVQNSLRVLEKNCQIIYRELWQRRIRPLLEEMNRCVYATTEIHRQIYSMQIKARLAQRERRVFRASVPLRVESALALVEDLKANTGRHMEMLFASRQLRRHSDMLYESVRSLFPMLPRSSSRLVCRLFQHELSLFMRQWIRQAHEYRRVHRLAWTDTIYPGMIEHEILSYRLSCPQASLHMLDDEIDTIWKHLQLLTSARGQPLQKSYCQSMALKVEIGHHVSRLAPAGFHLGRRIEHDKSRLQFFYNVYPLGSYLAHFTKFNLSCETLIRLMRPKVQVQIQDRRRTGFKEARTFSRAFGLFFAYHHARFDLEKVDEVTITQSCRQLVHEQHMQLVAQDKVLEEYELGVSASEVAHERLIAALGDGLYYPSSGSPSIPVEFITSGVDAQARLECLASGTVVGVHLHLPDNTKAHTSVFAHLVVATLDRVSIIVLDGKLGWTGVRFDDARRAFRNFWQEQVYPSLKIVSGFDEARQALESLHICLHHVVELPTQAAAQDSASLVKLGFERQESLSAIYRRMYRDGDLAWIHQLVYQALHNLYTFLGVGPPRGQHGISGAVRRLIEENRDDYRAVFPHNAQWPTLGPIRLGSRDDADLPVFVRELRVNTTPKRKNIAAASRLAVRLARDAALDGSATPEEHHRIRAAAVHYYTLTTFEQQHHWSEQDVHETLWLVDRFKLRLNDKDRETLIRRAEQHKQSGSDSRQDRSVEEDQTEATGLEDTHSELDAQQLDGDDSVSDAAVFSPFTGQAEDMLDQPDDDPLTDETTGATHKASQIAKVESPKTEPKRSPAARLLLAPLQALARRVASIRKG